MTPDHASDRDVALSTIDRFFEEVERFRQQDPATMTEGELWLYLAANRRIAQATLMFQRKLISSWVRATPKELVGTLPDVLAKALRISSEDAEQRIEEAMGRPELRGPYLCWGNGIDLHQDHQP